MFLICSGERCHEVLYEVAIRQSGRCWIEICIRGIDRLVHNVSETLDLAPRLHGRSWDFGRCSSSCVDLGLRWLAVNSARKSSWDDEIFDWRPRRVRCGCRCWSSRRGIWDESLCAALEGWSGMCGTCRASWNRIWLPRIRCRFYWFLWEMVGVLRSGREES